MPLSQTENAKDSGHYLHKKFYSDMPRAEFNSKIGFQPDIAPSKPGMFDDLIPQKSGMFDDLIPQKSVAADVAKQAGAGLVIGTEMTLTAASSTSPS